MVNCQQNMTENNNLNVKKTAGFLIQPPYFAYIEFLD